MQLGYPEVMTWCPISDHAPSQVMGLSEVIHGDESKDVRIMGQAELKFQGYRRHNPTLAYEVEVNWGWGEDSE